MRKVGAFGAGLTAVSTAPCALAGESSAEAPLRGAELKVARVPVFWSVQIEPKGRYIALAYKGRKWLSRLYVVLEASDKSYSSAASGTKLDIQNPATSGETLIKVVGSKSFTITFSSEDHRLVVGVRNVQGLQPQRIAVHATIEAGVDPIQCRLIEMHDDVQQMVSGLAISSLNDCIFDRFRDQAVRVSARNTEFAPSSSGFQVNAGTDGTAAPICSFEMVERVYQSRCQYYTPLDKNRWPSPPIGWCSFHYYGNTLDENDILHNAEALVRDYEAFGLKYILIDGGWQAHGISGNWTESNTDFLHGMKWLAEKIRALKLKPAVWLSVFGTDDEDFYNSHQSWFLHDASGNPKLGTWYGTYIADFSNPAMKEYLSEIYREMTVNWGYDYFKLDGENDTRDKWAQNRVRAYNPALDADTAFREALSSIRKAMSSRSGVFFSACGPVFPTESMGIAQSARLGGDIIGVAKGEIPSFRCVRTALEGMRRGYYTHNIAWYGDPDGVLARPPLTDDEVQTWFSVLGLTGQLLMLGDDMPTLSAERRDIPRKAMPVADIKPMELYPQSTTPHVWILHIGRTFGTWSVAGLFNWDFDSAENRHLEVHPDEHVGSSPVAPPPRRVVFDFAKAGLKTDREYLLFDFWKQEFIGSVKNEYAVTLTPHACQILGVRPSNGCPQVVGTDRHITMGAVELKNEGWNPAEKQLSLTLHLVQNYPTTITVYKAGNHFVKAETSSAALSATDDGAIVRLSLVSSSSGDVEVTLQFGSSGSRGN